MSNFPGKLKFIDLSAPLEHMSASEPYPPKFKYLDHRAGAEELGTPAGISADEFPDGIGLAWEEICSITHAGTHLDAPLHFGPTAGGKPARSIDQIPLDWCFGDGVVLDLTHLEPAAEITVADLRQALGNINYTLKPFDIVLLNTGASRKLGSADYLTIHPGVTREATLWLIEQGIKIVGTDGYGFDRPFINMLQDHKAGKPGSLWPGHFAGREKEYCHIEKLANLDAIPFPFGFKVAVFPVNIKGGTAGWCRPVAIIAE
jgi:kynurenine formamidase